MAKTYAETPLMKQYYSFKTKYPNALLLFRVGDFYETFGEDAVKTSEILGITLTKRANGSASSVELAGFPHHAIDTYLPRLIRAGERVAICDQLEDPKMAKGIVKRGVTELVTPGVSYNDKTLEVKENNFLAAIYNDKQNYGVSFLDVSTGEFYVAEGSEAYIDKLLQSFSPREVIIQKTRQRKFEQTFGEDYYTSAFDDWVFTSDFAKDLLLRHFEVSSFKGFGVEAFSLALVAAGAALHYLLETQHNELSHICKLSRIDQDKYVWLDRFTIRNLELLSSGNENATTLIDIIDKTTSPMGSRQMKRWVLLPLCDLNNIKDRHSMVSLFFQEETLRTHLRQRIREIGDLERLISKVAIGRVNPREIVQLKKSLSHIKEILNLSVPNNSSLKHILQILDPCEKVMDTIEKTIQPEPPIAINKGQVIKNGISEELDELRDIAYSGKDYLLRIQKEESTKTGIPSLKIGFNNVFGYYLEVTNAHKDKVPETWTRKQTLTNAERYITEELKHYEEKILGAEEKILVLEQQLFENLLKELMGYVSIIQNDARIIAELDCLLSFAQVAFENNYVCPEMHSDSMEISIIGGRHPVIEKQLPIGQPYIANDIFLDDKTQQIIIITGPNMSGKSALLRQTALIVLLAQIGSFVPATSAQLAMVDKIFTRVGASDNISSGESTFMVEMNETASILNNLSNRSLILLDEIGRGTSTYDGISIAWAIAQYLHEHPYGIHPKVLFATHYHEMIDMEKYFPRVKNYHVSVKEYMGKIIFLRKLERGGSEHSFGIHVAKMAGMPKEVLVQAEIMLHRLEEKKHSEKDAKVKVKPSRIPKSEKIIPKKGYQLSFVQLDDPLLEEIREDILNIDINTLTPVEALFTLHRIKKMLEKNK